MKYTADGKIESMTKEEYDARVNAALQRVNAADNWAKTRFVNSFSTKQFADWRIEGVNC